MTNCQTYAYIDIYAGNSSPVLLQCLLIDQRHLFSPTELYLPVPASHASKLKVNVILIKQVLAPHNPFSS